MSLSSQDECKRCACRIWNNVYYPCKLHEMGLPIEIRNYMRENKQLWGT